MKSSDNRTFGGLSARSRREGIRTAKARKRRRKTGRGSGRQSLNVLEEVDYIVGKAAQRDARVVTLGPLVFFSTETGDAWVLDPQEACALCLAREGSPLPVHIVETERKFAIEWTCTYDINGDVMTFWESSGRVKSVTGYPTRHIAEAARRVISN